MSATRQMFKMARWSNLARHAKNGTLVVHLLRKTAIRMLLKALKF